MEIIESAGRAPSLKLYPGICLTTEGKAWDLKKRDYWEAVGVEGRIILKWT